MEKKVSTLSMFSFALSVTPIIILVIKPLINILINIETPGFKLTLTFLIFPLLSIHSIILARLAASKMKEKKLHGEALAFSAVIIASITFIISIYKVATLNI